jgi:hypothetical protein
MQLVRFQFARRAISWRLGTGSAPTFAVPMTDEWLLLSPLLYDLLPGRSRPTNIVHVASGEVFAVTSNIIFASAIHCVAQRYKAEDVPEVLMSILEDLLLRLRHVSGQATIPKLDSVAMWSVEEIDKLPEYALPGEMGNTHVQEYLWTSAITSGHLSQALELGPNFIPPAHEIILLDAFAAHRGNNYRSAILYAAMAAEAVFGSVIENEYQQQIISSDDDRFRKIALPVAGGTKTYKDPVYERLRRRHNFDVLIHELSLYVLRRSLLVEDETLYQSAKTLYATRNKIVHAGTLAEDGTGKILSLDAIGSLKALETSLALFSWLGERSDFALPSNSFVPITGEESAE